MDAIIQYASLASKYLVALLSVWVLARCVRSLLRERYEPEVWGFLTFPDGSRASLYHYENIIGRARSADICVNDPSISRLHAVLVRSDKGRWRVFDLASRSGTYVGGEPVGRKGAVFADGDVLLFAGVAAEFSELTNEERARLSRARKAPSRFGPGVTLLMLTVIQAVLLLEQYHHAAKEYALSIITAFVVLMTLEWVCYLILRLLRRSGFEVETIALYLSSLGLSVAASSTPESMDKQIIMLVAGVVLFAVLGWWLRDLGRAKALRWPAAIGAVAFLALNLLTSEEIFGAKNWIYVAGFSIQPSEFVKIAYAYAGAATLDNLFRRRNVFVFVGFSALCVCALALMGDFGTALVFFVAFLVICFLRSGSVSTIILAISGAAIAGFFVLSVKPYIATRFASWGHIWEDAYGAGYQQTRALAAAASGGLFGQGAGAGWLHKIVAADTDLVFCLIAEELGLIVAVCAVAGIVVLAISAVRNAAQGRSSFYVIAACAAVSMMLTQVALNVFGSVDILPFTGVTFPFVSRGGSSLISCWALLAYIKAEDTRQGASFSVRMAHPERIPDADGEEDAP